MNQPARWTLFGLGLLMFFGALYATYRNATPPEHVRNIAGYEKWDKETLEIAEVIPVQDGGRIKPLSTYASFTMLRLYGARSMKITAEEGGEELRVKPLEWMLDAFFRPQFSVQMPSFRIEDSELLRAIGLKPGDRRDRYSYKDLEPGRDRLIELATGYDRIEPERRNPMEKQVIALASNIRTYEQLLGTFGVARAGLLMEPLSGSESAKRADVSAVMQTASVIQGVLQRSQTEGTPVPAHVQNLLQQLFDGANASRFGLFVFPPGNEGDDHWLSPGERMVNVIQMTTREERRSIDDIKLMENLSRSLSVGDEEFRKHLTEFKDEIVTRAEDRGEYGFVALEADYYRKNWFLYALVWFMMGTVLTIGMWMTGWTKAGKVFAGGVWLTTLLGLIYVIIPIVKRCIIMQRPPVGNLYDTIIFIAGAVIVFGALVELMTRRRFALGLLPIMGAMLILLARMFEVGDAKDHMDPLVAVLRSNYWLTTHVICITLGYAGGLVTAVLGMVYVALRGLRLDGGDKNLRRSLTRAVYGMVCLTLFLSLVGTVLGGIWANDSWGRFWGWDPKENGALMIVLANLAILHARLGGFLREWGLHLAAIAMAGVVTFSWWGVNILGTGLHSYGFAEGGSYINLLYGLVVIFIVFGLIARAVELAGKKDVQASKSLKEVEG